MIRSRRLFRLRQLAILLGGVALGFAVPAQAQFGRLLLNSSVTEREDHVDLTVEFACSLRYQTHLPASEGDTLRITLQPSPDCGLGSQMQFALERQLPADDVGLVRGIELSPGLTGGAELVVSWNRIEKYVLAPTAGMRGLRIRVIRTKQTGAALTVDDSPGAVGSYAINLDSSQAAFSDVELARARDLLKTPVFVSQVEVDGQPWHRLRAGPFFSRKEAERLLREARTVYGRAWLGIDDEQPAESTGEPMPPPAAAGMPLSRSGETRVDAALDQLLEQARKDLSAKRFDESIALLTKILLSADYLRRVDAQELLGLARERKGHLAHAKAEYEEYLRRYPTGKAVDRVRQRLKALRLASMPGRKGSGGGADEDGAWRLYGTGAQTYRRDNSKTQTLATSRDFVSQNAVITDVDVVARRRSERYDFTSRTSLGYLKDLTADGPGDQARLSTAYAELRDREQGWGAKAGRQSRGMAGIFGTFDGLLGTWQARPQLSINAVAGMPVDSSRAGLDSQRRFFGVAADIGTRSNTWDTSVYAILQQYAGVTDRQSIGVETRYLKPGRTLVGLLDYDVHFATVNNAMLLGTLVLPSQWTFNVDAGRQRSPVLSLRNALIGQPAGSLDTLLQQFTLAQIEQFAKDRSASMTQASLTASHPLGDRAQWSVSAYSVDISGTPSSGGIDAIPAFGLDNSLSSELLINSLFKAGDVASVALRYQQGGAARTMSLGLGSRLPLGDSWRLMSRLRADRRTLTANDTQQWLYAPSLRLDYLRRHAQFELETGAEFGNRTTGGLTERNTRYFISLGYRLSLDSSVR